MEYLLGTNPINTKPIDFISLYVYHINVHNTVQYCISRFFPIIFSFPQLLFPYCKKKNKKKKQTKFKLVIVVYNENPLKLQNMIYANKKFANIYR